MSDKPAAIMASLVDVRNIAAHKCVRLEIHVPVEQAASVMQAFGWPTMADPVPVAIARLETNKVDAEHGKDKRRFSELRPSQRAALLCKTVAFQKFYGVANEDQMAERLRELCEIGSRSELDTNKQARRAFEGIEADYSDWLNGPVV